MATKKDLLDGKQYLQKLLERETAISTLFESEGGAVLVRVLLEDVVGIVKKICSRCGELTIQEFVCLSSQMKTKMDLAEVITGSKKSEQRLSQELRDLLVVIEKEESGEVY